jgi:hypothetical protein
MNQPTMSAPAPDGAINSKENTASETSAELSAVHYKGFEEPVISPWMILVGVAAILATACFIYKSVPMFEHGRTLLPF